MKAVAMVCLLSMVSLFGGAFAQSYSCMSDGNVQNCKCCDVLGDATAVGWNMAVGMNPPRLWLVATITSAAGDAAVGVNMAISAGPGATVVSAAATCTETAGIG
jgi:hypothetical protein